MCFCSVVHESGIAWGRSVRRFPEVGLRDCRMESGWCVFGLLVGPVGAFCFLLLPVFLGRLAGRCPGGGLLDCRVACGWSVLGFRIRPLGTLCFVALVCFYSVLCSFVFLVGFVSGVRAVVCLTVASPVVGLF